MKKLISLLAVIALVTVLATAAFAADETALVIKDVEAAPGAEVTLNIEIVNNPGITLGEFVFEFDTTALEFVSAACVGGEGWDWSPIVNDDVDNAKFGTVVFSANKAVLEGDAVLVTLTLKVKEDVKPGKYPVSAVVDFIGDDYADLIYGTTITGYVVIPCTEHVWDEGTVKTPAGCETDGVMEYKCIYCDATKEEAIPAEGHAWGDWTVTTEAKCGVAGEETRTCSKCNETETREIAALEHNWVETERVEPTCKDGKIVYTCSLCGETKEEVLTANGEHNWVETERVEATGCTDGKVVYTCSICGETKEEVLTASGEHTWGEWTVTTEAKCGVAGEETRTCSVCGKIETREIAALEHAWAETERVEATCCENGKIVYTCSACNETKEEVLNATGEHKYAYVAIDDVNHKIVCENSGKELGEEAHTFGDYIDDPENPGWKYQECEKCHYKLLDEPDDTGDNSMIAVVVATVSMLGIAVVVSKKKEF